MPKKDSSCYGGKQPRIGTAEKQKSANKPRPVSKEDADKHPGSD